MAVKSPKQEAIERAILRDKIEKKKSYELTAKEEKLKLKRILESSSQSERGTFRRLGELGSGTRFEALELPELRGCVISATFGAVRVLLDTGMDTTLSPSMQVYTGSAKAEKKPKVREKVQKEEPPPPPKRPRVFGYTGVRLVYFLGSKGWTFQQVRSLFDAFEVPLADTTIQMTLDSVNDPRYFDPAQVTDEHYVLMQRAIE